MFNCVWVNITIMYSTDLEGIQVMQYIYDVGFSSASRGICKLNDIAVTVLASVIHHKVQEKIIIDAKLSISKDLTANKFIVQNMV